MKPSAPALGTPPSSKGGGGGGGDDRDDGIRDRPAFSLATGSSHLLTRLSLHGQGVRTIEGLEACQNLKVLVRSRYILKHIANVYGECGRHTSLDCYNAP